MPLNPQVVKLTYRTLLKDCRNLKKYFKGKEASDLKSITFSEIFPQHIRLAIPLRFVEGLFTTNNFAEIVKWSYRNYYKERTKEQRYEEYIKRKQEREVFIERYKLELEETNSHFKVDLKKLIDNYSIQNADVAPDLSEAFELFLQREELQDIKLEMEENNKEYLALKFDERENIDKERLNLAFAALRANSDVLTFVEKYKSEPKPKLDLGTIVKHSTQGFYGVVCKSYDFLPTMDSTNVNVAQNHYLCLVNPKTKSGFCYDIVAEEEIEPITEHIKLHHSHFDRLFSGFDESTRRYIPVQSLIDTQKKIDEGKDYYLAEYRDD